MKKLDFLPRTFLGPKAPKFHGLKPDVELKEIKNGYCKKFTCDRDGVFCSENQVERRADPCTNSRCCKREKGNDDNEEDDANNYDDLDNSELCFKSSKSFSKFNKKNHSKTKSGKETVAVTKSNPNSKPELPAPEPAINYISKLNFKALSTLTFNFPSTHRENSSSKNPSFNPHRDRDWNWNENNSSYACQDHDGNNLLSHEEEIHRKPFGSQFNLDQPDLDLDLNRDPYRSKFNSKSKSKSEVKKAGKREALNFLIPPEPDSIYQSTTTICSTEDLFPVENAHKSDNDIRKLDKDREIESKEEADNMSRYREEVSENFPLTGRRGGDEGEEGDVIVRKKSNLISWALFLGAMGLSVILFFGILTAVLETKTPFYPDEPISDFKDTLNTLPILKSVKNSLGDSNTGLASTEGDFLTLKQSAWPLEDTRKKSEKQFKLQLSPGGLAVSSSNIHPVLIVIPIPLFKEADESVIADGLKAGEIARESREKIEEQLFQMGFSFKAGYPSSTYSIATSWTNDEAQLRAIKGFMMDAASQKVAQKLNLTKMEARDGIIINSVSNFEPHEFCPSSVINQIQCESSLYRSYDGTCNNLHHERWGASFEPYRRILLPDYADGITKPRVASDGSPLPIPRKITTSILQNDPTDDPLATFMLVLWAQFVEHDIFSTAQSAGFNSTAIACCHDGKLVKPQHPECLPITLPKDDFFYSMNSIKQSCNNMVRSAPAPICELGPREQFNQLTSYLDASTLYGTTVNDSKTRSPLAYPGRLQHSYINDGRPLLPRSVDLNDGCNSQEHVDQVQFCFKSGDKGVNEYVGLTSMNLIWVRQHNLIAEHLSAINTWWDSTRIFEESRRIVIAQIQHITYNEFLPVLIGPGLMHAAGIKLLPLGYYQDYDDQVDATISNVFASAAFPMTHSMIQGVVKMIGPRWKNEDIIQLHKLLFNPFQLYELGKLDAILRGHAGFPAGKADLHFTPQIVNHFFQLRNNSFGLDLPAMDIQRGRDHGLPGYTEWRRICNLTVVNNFTDLVGIWSEEDVERVETVYDSVDDIDLYIGGLAETSIPDAMVGPTFACILADQFLRLRKGDRFWYEGNIQLKPFTSAQLEVIRQTTLASVLCSNGDDLKLIQPLVMQKESPATSELPGNPRQSCSGKDIPDMQYHAWKEDEGTLFKSAPSLEFSNSKSTSGSGSKLNLLKSSTTAEKDTSTGIGSKISLNFESSGNKTTKKSSKKTETVANQISSKEDEADSLESLFTDDEEEERFEIEHKKDYSKPTNLTEHTDTNKAILNFNKTETTVRPAVEGPVKVLKNKSKVQSSESNKNLNKGNEEKIEFSKGSDGKTILEWKQKRSADAGSRYREAHEKLGQYYED